MRAIKLCPACNSTPELIRVGNWKEYFIVMCPKCYHIAAEHDEASMTERGAIRIWNERR